METVAIIFSFIYQYADNIGFLLLAAVGLIIIFGMMGVINMAHGELMMIGAYITAFAYHAGVPAPIAIIFAGIGSGLAGIVLERLVIRFFYRQLLSSLVVTWGISLVLTEGFLLVFGPSILNVPTPFGSFGVGELTFGIYRLVLFGVALLLIGLILGALYLHALRRPGAGHDGKSGDGGGVRDQHVPNVCAHIRPGLGAGRCRGRHVRPDGNHLARSSVSTTPCSRSLPWWSAVAPT